MSEVTRDTQLALNGSPGFAEFYAAYPRHVARGAAVKAWDRAVKVGDPEVIVQAAEAFARQTRLVAAKFIPHPATWLNQMRWEDETLAAVVEGPRPVLREVEVPVEPKLDRATFQAELAKARAVLATAKGRGRP